MTTFMLAGRISLLLAFVGTLFVSICPLASSEPTEASSPEVIVERITTITATELWNMLGQEVVFSDAGAVVAFWRFGKEYHQKHEEYKGLEALGIIATGLGDIGETPSAFRVWSRPESIFLAEMSRSFSKSSDDAIVFIGSSLDKCKPHESVACKDLYWDLKVSSIGEVFIEGELVARVQ